MSAFPFPTSLLPPPAAPTCSMCAQSPPPILVLLTITPSPLHTHTLSFTLLPILFSLHWFVNHWGWVVCCMGHWCDMHLSLQDGDTPLMRASLRRRDGCVQLLLDRGAQIDHQDKVSAFRDQPSVSLYYVLLCEEGIV